MSNLPETSDSNNSNICESTDKLLITRPKTFGIKTDAKRHKHKRNFIYDDSDPTSLSPRSGSPSIKVPSCTSQWTTTHLDALGTFYDECPSSVESLLDMVFTATDMFCPLSSDQRALIKQVQDKMNFSCTLSDVCKFAWESRYCKVPEKNVYKDILRHAEENDEEELWNDRTSYVTGLVQDFVVQLVMMIELMIQTDDKNLPEAVWEDIFKMFLSLCGLCFNNGKAWKAKQEILGCQKVKSEADITITARQPVKAASVKRNLLTVVSIVTVKNVSHISPQKFIKTRTPGRKTSDSESDIERAVHHKEPAVFHQIGTDVLGQHGGELLIHTKKYGTDLSNNGYLYRPGMIVVGTKVTFTLLVCSTEYIWELETSKTVEQEKAVIYYSDQKDLLVKEDRDLLLESLARFKNFCHKNVSDSANAKNVLVKS